MNYVDRWVLPRLREKGLRVADLRATLPRNTIYPRLKRWSTRPLAAISLFSWHYPARPLRPEGDYDEVARIAAFARAHINADWGGGNHAPTLTYHTVIGGGGTLYLCNDWEDVTWHANNANGIALGFMVDMGEGQQPTPAQLATCELLADFVSIECPEIPADQWDHYGHGELTGYGNATACPGALRPFIQTYRQHGDLVRDLLAEQRRQEEEHMEGIIAELNNQVDALRQEIAAKDSELGALRAHELEPLRQQVRDLEALLAASANTVTVTGVTVQQTARVQLSNGTVAVVPVAPMPQVV